MPPELRLLQDLHNLICLLEGQNCRNKSTVTISIGWRPLRYGQNSWDHSHIKFLSKSPSVMLSLTNTPLVLTALCLSLL